MSRHRLTYLTAIALFSPGDTLNPSSSIMGTSPWGWSMTLTPACGDNTGIYWSWLINSVKLNPATSVVRAICGADNCEQLRNKYHLHELLFSLFPAFSHELKLLTVLLPTKCGSWASYLCHFSIHSTIICVAIAIHVVVKPVKISKMQKTYKINLTKACLQAFHEALRLGL